MLLRAKCNYFFRYSALLLGKIVTYTYFVLWLMICMNTNDLCGAQNIPRLGFETCTFDIRSSLKFNRRMYNVNFVYFICQCNHISRSIEDSQNNCSDRTYSIPKNTFNYLIQWIFLLIQLWNGIKMILNTRKRKHWNLIMYFLRIVINVIFQSHFLEWHNYVTVKNKYFKGELETVIVFHPCFMVI